MSAPDERPKAGHEVLAEAMKAEAPRMDDLRRARLERRVLAGARGGATTSHAVPAVGSVAAGAARPAGSRTARYVGAAVALAAAAVIGFVARGALTPEPTPVATGPSYAIGSAFETRQGALSAGSRIALAEGEEARLEIGDVTAQVRDGGVLEVRSVADDDVRLVLDAGSAELAFHPHARGRQHLRVITPSADVEVVGTVFTVRVDPRGTDVSVREGTVRVVRRVGEPTLVHAGESVRVEAAVTAAAGAATAPETAPEPEPEPEIVAAAESVTAIRTGTELEPEPESVTVTDSVTEPEPESVTESETETETESETETETETEAEPESGTGTEAAIASPEVVGDLTSIHARPSPLDSWAAHRPSSREIAGAWHDIDELQARGQFERSLALLVRLERYAPASDQDEALFDRARTVQEALRRPLAARALYSDYVRRFPEGRHLQEVRRRLVALGAPADGDPLAPSVEPTTPEPPAPAAPAQETPAQETP
jgi:ferric-dicitrate binding protein FerR (iron transport regulator)